MAGRVVVEHRGRHAEQAGIAVLGPLQQPRHRLEQPRAYQDEQPEVVAVMGQHAATPRPFPDVDRSPVDQLEEVALSAGVAGQIDGARGALPAHLQHETAMPVAPVLGKDVVVG